MMFGLLSAILSGDIFSASIWALSNYLFSLIGGALVGTVVYLILEFIVDSFYFTFFEGTKKPPQIKDNKDDTYRSGLW